MTEEEKREILIAARAFFTERVVISHIENTQKLRDIRKFHINPFIIRYLARFAFGNADPVSIAKALIYPRVLGTSITTSFGTHIQYFCKDVLYGYASTTSGIDIEFEDTVDGRHKYCQIKSGPDTLNKDDVPVIKNHFRGLINLGRTNGIRIASDDCIVGVLYGTKEDLSGHYLRINEDYPVYCGQEFWKRLTGDPQFYFDLIQVFSDVAEEMDGTQLLQETVNALAESITQQKSLL